MLEHAIGTRDEWQATREKLLEPEKELTRLNDELARPHEVPTIIVPTVSALPSARRPPGFDRSSQEYSAVLLLVA